MVERITAEQVRAWLDEQVVSDVQESSEGDAEYNLQIELSLLPHRFDRAILVGRRV